MNNETTSESTPKRKILIVEDCEHVSGMLLEMISRLGYEGLVVKDGHDALTHIQTFTPDLIISGIKMATMSGIEMGQELRECGVTTPILYFSGSLTPNSLAHIKPITSFWLNKPAPLIVITAKIAEIFKNAA